MIGAKIFQACNIPTKCVKNIFHWQQNVSWCNEIKPRSLIEPIPIFYNEVGNNLEKSKYGRQASNNKCVRKTGITFEVEKWNGSCMTSW